MSFEEQETTLTYKQMQEHIGFIVMKPDAIELGVAEELIGMATEKLLQEGIHLLHGEVITIESEVQLRLLYPHIDEADFWRHMKDYFLGNLVAVTVYYSHEPTHIERTIKNIKGPRPRDWEITQLEGARSIDDFLRALIPVPGTEQVVKPLLEKILESKRRNGIFEFTDAEFAIYSRNLVHSPEGEDEYQGMLKLLSADTRNLILESLEL